jgi:hypothetical protein
LWLLLLLCNGCEMAAAVVVVVVVVVVVGNTDVDVLAVPCDICINSLSSTSWWTWVQTFTHAHTGP